MIDKPHQIELEIKAPGPEKQRIRQQKAIPQLNQIREWLDKTLHRTLRKRCLAQCQSL